MKSKFKNFSDVMRENICSYEGKYDGFIDYCPDLFKLLTDILDDENIDSEMRLEICAAIAYFVVPLDVIPEQIYGPIGYIDDIFLCCYVINYIVESLGWERVNELWQCDKDLQEVLDECYSKSIAMLGGKTNDILVYVGLKS